ncbi:MAG: MFS transporter [Solirubrobacterales bacterium]|nr:MFS transporter [Solirubrobacterales bacterium]MCB8970516.1 MFS transporter [Thermoleophilales bacterium]MCO5325679.1 MFS transporter [Solirubrobacterales bacterium]
MTGPDSRQHYGVTLAVLVTGALAYALSQTLVAPALPDIQRELHTSTTAVTYVLTAYLLSASIATPILGRLGDMFGKERVLVATLSVFAVGSLVAALSHSIEMLIAGRAIQGAAGAVFPLSFGIIRDEFPPERVPAGIGLISATFGIGGGAGLVLSGLIVDHLSYEWIFWLGLVVVAVAIVATRLFVPESPVKSPAKIDWGGAGLLAAGLVALLVGISEGNSWGWGSARILALFVAAAIILVIWVRFESRRDEPLVDIEMMRRRPVWTTNLTGLLIGFGMFGSFILIPQFVQMPESAGYGFGASVTQAGLFLLPSAGMMLFAGPMAGFLGSRFGSKLPLLIGTVVVGLSFVFLTVAHDERWMIYVASAMLGIGIGFSFAAMANLIVEAVDQTETGVATGINTIMRTIGGALGGQIAASVVAAEVGAGGLPAESGFTTAFLISACAIALAAVCAALVPGRASAAGVPAGEGSA